MSDIIEDLCEKMHSAFITFDLKKFICTRTMPMRLFGEEDEEGTKDQNNLEDMWQGYYRGYEAIHNAAQYSSNGQMRCIELATDESDAGIMKFLRSGIRCFAIDLFSGTEWEHQMTIARLRDNEDKMALDIGFSINSTLIAMITPHLPHIGLLSPPGAIVYLKPGDTITLTTDRYWSSRGNNFRVYVNARYLFADLRVSDHLMIDNSIQLRVRYVMPPDRLLCAVVVGGALKSRAAVRFPDRLNKLGNPSLEEMEDIAFAKKTGINVIVSYMTNNKKYFNDLLDCIHKLNCKMMQLWARVVLNELTGCFNQMNWIAESYDGLYIEFTPPQLSRASEPEAQLPPILTEVLSMSFTARLLLERAYELNVPIIMDVSTIAQDYLIVPMKYRLHIFYYPDKYLLRCDNATNNFNFNQLLSAEFAALVATQPNPLASIPWSPSCCDTLARAWVATAIEINATFILVVSQTGRMVKKISHFRPTVPVLFVTLMKSVRDFISVYHQVKLLYYPNNNEKNEDFQHALYKQMTYGLRYGLTRKLVCQGQRVVLAYDIDMAKSPYPDRYISFQFDEVKFQKHLRLALFGN